MSFINMFIEKIAEEKFDNDLERELILKAQSGDVIALKRLRKIFDGTIKDAISRSGVSTDNVPQDALLNAAMKEFRRSIQTYDPNSGTKPSSWITGNIQQDLTKLDRMYKNETRLADSSTITLGNVEQALKQLDVEDDIKDPTSEDIQRKIKQNFEKDVELDEISNLMKRRRKEYSLNQTIGTGETGEELSFGDVKNVSSITPKDYMDAANDGEKLNDALSKLDDVDRDLYEQFKGIGKHKGISQPNLLDFAKTNNFGSEYYAKKKISDIENKLKGHLGVNDKPGNK